MHAERGLITERRSGTRTASTFRKLPTASPGARAKAASAAFTWDLSAAGGCELNQSVSAGEALRRVRLCVDVLVGRHPHRHGRDEGEGVRRQVVAENDLAADDRPVDVDVVPELDRIDRVEPALIGEVVHDLDTVTGIDLTSVPVGDDHQQLVVGIPTSEVAAGAGDGGTEGAVRVERAR